jgi:hypothetical protein
MVSILIQLDAIHTPTSHFLKIPSTPGSPHWSLFFRFPHQNPVHASPLPQTRYMLCPTTIIMTIIIILNFYNVTCSHKRV